MIQTPQRAHLSHQTQVELYAMRFASNSFVGVYSFGACVVACYILHCAIAVVTQAVSGGNVTS